MAVSRQVRVNAQTYNRLKQISKQKKVPMSKILTAFGEDTGLYKMLDKVFQKK